MIFTNDVFTVPSSTALAMGEHLLLLLNTVTRNLPECELRKMRSAMEHSVRLADELLYNLKITSFDALIMNGASTIRGGDVFTSAGGASFRSPTRNAVASRIPVQPSSPVSVMATDETFFRSPVLTYNEVSNSKKPVAARNRCGVTTSTATISGDTASAVTTGTPTETHQKEDPDHPFFLSCRPRVGVPNYTYHPAFVRTGIPGPYTRPPTDPSKPEPSGAYYVITKGIYVGIFYNWIECSPWVKGIPKSNFLRVTEWAEAMELYNNCLAADACEVIL